MPCCVANDVTWDPVAMVFAHSGIGNVERRLVVIRQREEPATEP